MNPRVKSVRPQKDATLLITFTNGEVRLFDVKPFLTTGMFRELKEPRAFNAVKPFMGSVQWRSGQDLCPDTLYLQSKPVTKAKKAA